MNMPNLTWRRAAYASLVLSLLLIATFWSTVHAMVQTWLVNDTYGHGFVILPISLWLVWRRREQLAALSPTPAPVVLLLVLLAAFGWAMARLLSVQVIEQLAFITLWLAALWSLLGHRVAAELSFPLLFSYLMVPMGEGLVPPMMDFTADFTVKMVELTGVPVYREGLYFTLPSGSWSVVDACSGVRYLIASATLGLLYAYLSYRSLWRRLLFVLLSLVVPVLANGVRAYLIVMLGHLSDMTVAVGVDHLIYGWVFFGLVMLLLFWLGGLWAEPHEPQTSETRVVSQATAGLGAGIAVVAAAALTGIGVQAGVGILSTPATDLRAVALPSPGQGWRQIAAPQLDWPATLTGADRTLRGSYAKDDVPVAMVIGLYAAQRQGAEVVSSDNRLLRLDVKDWRIVGNGRLQLASEPRPLTVPAYQLSHQRDALLGVETGRLTVVQWYRLGRREAGNEYLGKWYQALGLLRDGRNDGAYVMLATPSDEHAARRLHDFAAEVLPAVWADWDRALQQE